MTYTSRHMRRPGRRPALFYYMQFARDTPPRPRLANIDSYQPQLFQRSKEDEAQLKQLRARHSKDWSQTDAQAFEDIIDRDNARSDASKEPLRLIIYSYFEHLNLPPLPPPLPGCSTSVLFTRAEKHSNESIRPFMVACDKGLLEEVKSWTEDGERIEELQQLGLQDGLVYAARADQVEIVRYLLDERWTPLNGEVVREACDNLSLPLFELCVQHGYHPNQQIPSRDGHFGVAINHCVQDVDITRFLLEHGADPDLAPFKDGRLHDWGEKATPPMDRTSGLALDLAVEKSPTIVVQTLLEYGAHPRYSRPLHGVVKRLHCHSIPGAQQEWRPLMTMVLSYGADINAVTYSGGTALQRAVHNKNWDIVEFLIERGANPFTKCPASKEDSFDDASLGLEDQPWRRSQEVKEYLKRLTSGSKLEIGEEAPEEVRDNPLVQIIQKVRRREAGLAE
ncbi:ankyrin repeat domain protein [Fusarium tjaetaba]|uniref:Ankyrin repeat domain protein n=1 Tax=Fusarium tjaetaba TaxID=1567544 RepID=A0A8H5QWK7_9HYPO|nr:ankyrin repeat domain protein [Fusarium tjaetaba]KAF5621126.1 ankyrin repeat domain protein [Fusarium tjaetaba]